MVSKTFAKSSDYDCGKVIGFEKVCHVMKNDDYCGCGGSSRSECIWVFEEEIHGAA